MKNPDISIIIPTIGRDKIFNRTLKSLIEATQIINTEILVINDSGKPLNVTIKSDKIFIYNNPKSGAASARNLGIEKSKGNLLLFLDDDIIVNEYNIKRTLYFHDKYEKSAFNFFWIYPPDLIEKLTKTKFGRYILRTLTFTNSFRLQNKLSNENTLIKENGLTSQYFSIKKQYIIDIGGYEENIPFAGIEDILLARKLLDIGITLYLSTSDIVFQNEENRIELCSVMQRYKKGAITNKKAVQLGYNYMEIKFNKLKFFFYKILYPFKKIIYDITEALPNLLFFDPFYQKLTNLLLGLSTFEGYYLKKADN